MGDFAHASEQAFADLLDFYGIAWQYEPTTFVLEHGPDGAPAAAMTPDFFLPDHDVYVELTTMQQRLVTRKNRKIRLLRERYDDVDVRILYADDLDALLGRHGLHGAAA